ncbi:MAG TPA: CAP domain-containing protein [Pirellulaceae bacterium]|nr:CAP domain-containing protein [Pirellulaceae bacterium]
MAKSSWIRCGLTIITICLLPQISRAADQSKELTPAQKKAIQSIAVEFRKTKVADARMKLIRQAGEIAPAGIEPLLQMVGTELNKELLQYRTLYIKAASGTASEKLNAATVQEMTELRAKVLQLSQREDLSKEMIVEVGDPALARLKQLVLVDAREVFKRDPKLVDRREQLGKLGTQWELCAELLTAGDGTPPNFSAYLLKEEEIASALALPMDPRTREILATNAQLAPKLDPEEARCILDLNLTRNLLGLNAVAIDPALVLCARDHSSDMQKLGFFSHESPIPAKKTPWDRAKLFNTSASGENIAAGTIDGAAANLMWWHSPGHHKNMLGAHQRVGVGRTGKMWTEMFGG